MSPVFPISTLNTSSAPGIPFISKRNKLLSRCSFPRAHYKPTPFAQKYVTPLSTSIRLFPQFRIRTRFDSKNPTHVAPATGTDVAPEETDTTEANKEVSDTAVDSSEKSDPSTVKSKKNPRTSRKSELPPVKNEDLVPGATFTGKVMSIQPFGAFVDFGAFTDGLVHVSRLADSFVKDVSTVVTVGQEVTVRLVEANFENGRISLSMRENDDQKTNRTKDEAKKTSKFRKGQDLKGTVKNLIRSGAFVSLPEGEEGFLPTSEEANKGFRSVMGESSLEIGQEVDVRVLRISRGRVTLTMKKEEYDKELNSKLNSGVVHKATNPFVVAFRRNKEISEFLDERAKVEEPVEETVNGSKDVSSSETLSKEEEPSDEAVETSSGVITDDVAPPVEDQITPEEPAETEVEEEKGTQISAEGVSDALSEDSEESTEPAAEDVSSAALSESELSEEISPIGNEKGPEASAEVTDQVVEEKDNDVIETGEISSNTVPYSEEDGEPAEAPNVQEGDGNVAAQVDPSTPEATTAETQVTPDIIENSGNDKPEDEIHTPISPSEEENTSVSSPNGQISDSVAKETTTKATISPALVKQLREETGAGMMDCKRALSETEGDITKAYEYLRKKGLASADKKASRATAEGRLGSYIHDSRIGVLIEVNCETDFVARGDIFKELVEDIAMQVAACPQVKYINAEDVPKEIVDKETEIEMQKEDLFSKPEQIRSKIVEGRVRKTLEEMALLEQPFIKDDKVVVKDWVKQRISTVGENIKVKRFVRYNLGEGLEKKSQDFAAEVAAQTAAKPASALAEKEPAASETKETTDTPAISAALVKQLREETGAGMMDCKRALAETGGDLEKAHEHLRKKGLSSAEKKSKRLAAEGRIGSYIHDSRIGVLIEVNCETDFVGRSQPFKELVDDLAMQAVACPQVRYVSVEDIPEGIAEKEKELEMQREDLKAKPENVREKIVEGRIAKRLGELALLEQAFIKDDAVLVKDLVKQTVATIGENIKVRRFVRFTLGEE